MALTEKNFKNILIYLLPRAGSFALNFLTLPIFTRLLTPEDFGLVALVYAFPMIAVSVATAGLNSAVPRYYFEYRNDPGKLYALYFSSQAYLFLMFLLSGTGVYLFKNTISTVLTGKGLYGLAVFIAYISFYFDRMNNFYLRIYQNEEKVGLYGIFVTLQSALSIMASLVLVYFFRLSYMGMLYGVLIGTVLTFGCISIHFNKTLQFHFSLKILKENILFGLQVVPKSFSGFINKFFDKYMLNAMLSMSATGVYSFGQKLTSAVDIIMDNIWMAFQPLYYGEVFDKGNEAATEVGKIFTVFSYLSLFPILLTILFAEEILFIVAPPSYHEAAGVIIILAAGITTQIFGKYVSVQYAYAKKPFWIFPMTIAGALLTILGNIILIPRYGITGAGWATVISMTAVNILATYIGQKLYRINYEWRIISGLMALITVAMLLMLNVPGNFSYWCLLLVKIVLISAYLLLGFYWKIISIGKLRKILKRSRA